MVPQKEDHSSSFLAQHIKGIEINPLAAEVGDAPMVYIICIHKNKITYPILLSSVNRSFQYLNAQIHGKENESKDLVNI